MNCRLYLLFGNLNFLCFSYFEKILSEFLALFMMLITVDHVNEPVTYRIDDKEFGTPDAEGVVTSDCAGRIVFSFAMISKQTSISALLIARRECSSGTYL